MLWNVMAVFTMSMMIMREQKRMITFFLVLMEGEQVLTRCGMVGCSGITDSNHRLTDNYLVRFRRADKRRK